MAFLSGDPEARREADPAQDRVGQAVRYGRSTTAATTRSSTIDTTAIMSVAQIVVHQKSSIVSFDVRASVISSSRAFTRIANSPNVRIVSGNARDVQDRSDDRVDDAEDQGDPQVGPRPSGDLHPRQHGLGHRERRGGDGES